MHPSCIGGYALVGRQRSSFAWRRSSAAEGAPWGSLLSMDLVSCGLQCRAGVKSLYATPCRRFPQSRGMVTRRIAFEQVGLVPAIDAEALSSPPGRCPRPRCWSRLACAPGAVRQLWSGSRIYHPCPRGASPRLSLFVGFGANVIPTRAASGFWWRLRALLAVGPALFSPLEAVGLAQGLGFGQDLLHLLRSVGAQGLAGDVARLSDPEQSGHHGLFAWRIHHGH